MLDMSSFNQLRIIFRHSCLITGQVWRYRIGKKEFEELKIEDPDSVVPDKVNYQMYISGENNSMCFLLNVHTGQMWRYMFKDGERTFNKLTMPWDK